jgi:hypothetical protein
VHSTPRRIGSKIQAEKPTALPAIDPTTLPDEYCLCLDGDCLEPMIPDRAAIWLKKSETFGTGGLRSRACNPRLIVQAHSFRGLGTWGYLTAREAVADSTQRRLFLEPFGCDPPYLATLGHCNTQHQRGGRHQARISGSVAFCFCGLMS